MTTISTPPNTAWIRYSGHNRIRTDGYVLLASLLINAPSRDLIELVQDLHWQEDLSPEIVEALAVLNRAAFRYPQDSIAQEFQRLFVGLGSGELVPYGSWYLEKMIQSAPLAAIRGDLVRLGIVRKSTCFEPEDHGGALCEIMALLSLPENGVATFEQAAFFQQHLGSWMPGFFQDMQRADQSPFYQRVGVFGEVFLADEKKYLQNFSTREEGI